MRAILTWIWSTLFGSCGGSTSMSPICTTAVGTPPPLRPTTPTLHRESTRDYLDKDVQNSKRVVFRVQGIPYGFSKPEAVKQLLEAALGISSLKSGLEVYSNADNPLNTMDKSRVATVAFDTIPKKLKRQTQTFNFEYHSQPIELRIDTDFYGFTVLHSPDPPTDANVDCISISGIGSHAFGSFKERDGTYMWLRDSLPGCFPRMRVITYGYQSRLEQNPTSKMSYDYGKDFVEGLAELRRDLYQSRPIIFVAHSFGGIIVKQALVQISCQERDDPTRTILKSTRGILSFGVPNLGMEIDHLLPMTVAGVNERFVRSLGEDSEELKHLDKASNEIINNRKIQVFAFYELQKSRTAKKVKEGKWKEERWTMTGEEQKLVNERSATSGCPLLNRFPMDRSHSELVKFRRDDDSERLVLKILSQLIEEISTLD